MQNFALSVILVSVVAFLVGKGASALVNRVSGRRIFNTSFVGTICTFPWSLAPVYVLATLPDENFKSLSASERGQLEGSLMFPSLLVLVLGFGLAFLERRAFLRRKGAAVTASAPET